MTQCRVCGYHYHPKRHQCPICGGFKILNHVWSWDSEQTHLHEIVRARGVEAATMKVHADRQPSQWRMTKTT